MSARFSRVSNSVRTAVGAALFAPLFLAAETELVDIRDPLRLWTRLEWYLLLAVLIVALLAGLLIARLRRRREAKPTEARVWVNAYGRAREELSALEREAGTMPAELFSVNASRILRVFIEETLRLPATERTTEEFLREFQDQAKMDDAIREALAAFLEQCDLAKFGRQDLSAEARADMIAKARAFVDSVERAQRREAETSLPATA